MTQYFKGYPVTFKRSLKAKRISLRLAANRKEFILTMPWYAFESSAQKFLVNNVGWLAKTARLIQKDEPRLGDAPIKLLGEEVSFISCPEAKRGVWREGSVIYVSGDVKYRERRIKEYMEKELATYIKQQIAVYAEQFPLAKSKIRGGKVARVTIRHNSSRWGSCSTTGTLSFNFSLCYVEKPLIDYVIVHEICHFAQMNHSNEFWQEVANLYPDYKNARKKLKASPVKN